MKISNLDRPCCYLIAEKTYMQPEAVACHNLYIILVSEKIMFVFCNESLLLTIILQFFVKYSRTNGISFDTLLQFHSPQSFPVSLPLCPILSLYVYSLFMNLKYKWLFGHICNYSKWSFLFCSNRRIRWKVYMCVLCFRLGIMNCTDIFILPQIKPSIEQVR